MKPIATPIASLSKAAAILAAAFLLLAAPANAQASKPHFVGSDACKKMP